MNEKICILVLGADTKASAAARLLFLAGHSVVLYGSEAGKVLRRPMSFADAWSRGAAMLDAVEARRMRGEAEFVAGLRRRHFIPVLTRSLAFATGRRPWDAIVDGRSESERANDSLAAEARLRVGLGAGFMAGEDCDLAIATEGPDPGAVIRSGRFLPAAESPGDRTIVQRGRLAAPLAGSFSAELSIGDGVGQGEIIGSVAGEAIRSPFAGRILGLLPRRAPVAAGEPLAEITPRLVGPFSGVSRGDQALARAIHFAIEMEFNGWAPVSPPSNIV
jgi:xanthine dehydrogenase accessory factor